MLEYFEDEMFDDSAEDRVFVALSGDISQLKVPDDAEGDDDAKDDTARGQ